VTTDEGRVLRGGWKEIKNCTGKEVKWCREV